MAAMEQTKEKYDAVNALLAERYGDDEEELDKISKGYEEIRRMVDNQRINQVNFKMESIAPFLKRGGQIWRKVRESNPRAVADDTFPRCCITALPTFQMHNYTCFSISLNV